jgi:hypothetical protein
VCALWSDVAHRRARSAHLPVATGDLVAPGPLRPPDDLSRVPQALLVQRHPPAYMKTLRRGPLFHAAAGSGSAGFLSSSPGAARGEPSGVRGGHGPRGVPVHREAAGGSLRRGPVLWATTCGSPDGVNRMLSGCGDLNPGPPAPKAGALPSCATSRAIEGMLVGRPGPLRRRPEGSGSGLAEEEEEARGPRSEPASFGTYGVVNARRTRRTPTSPGPRCSTRQGAHGAVGTAGRQAFPAPTTRRGRPGARAPR